MGFEPKKTQECDTGPPDFTVDSEDSKYLIELKTKLDGGSKLKERGVILSAGHIYNESINIALQIAEFIPVFEQVQSINNWKVSQCRIILLTKS
jgi:hypothetical protein